ncbi:MAG: hypothetical protein AAGH57_09235 [Pseudomonadota bacterium]
MTAPFEMPPARDFGWTLKATPSTGFEIIKRANGQFCVVLNHSLLRGVTSDMLHWWFQNFANLTVTLDDTPGYEGVAVPAYLLWHPSDHCSAALYGDLGPGATARAGAKIHIREAMQFATYGLKYPVNTALQIFYCARDGWAMGKSVPILGKAMCLRISFKDVVKDGRTVGVHYHYEVVIGVDGDNPIARALNRKITGSYSPEFFDAWHLHNTIEVGTFENFLAPLYAQREDPRGLRYARAMDPMAGDESTQTAFDPELFERRVEEYKRAQSPVRLQAAGGASFL